MNENHYNCIYMYTSHSGKSYVGQAINFLNRHKQHLLHTYNDKYDDYNTPFHRAIRKYGGIENFTIIILKENLTKDEMNYWEDYYIENFDLYAKNDNGYNIAKGGNNGNPLEGKTEEEKNEIRKKQSESHKGVSKSKEHIHKISESHKGKEVSEETKYKISENAKINPNYGMKNKHLSEETKQKKSDECKNRFKNRKNHPRCKMVNQYDLNGNLIKTWNNAKDISEELNIKYNTLLYYLQGKAKTNNFKGFIFKYKGDDDNE